MPAERDGRAGFRGELVETRGSSHVASYRPKEVSYPHRVTSHPIDLADVGASNVLEVATQRPRCVSRRQVGIKSGPSAPAQGLHPLGQAAPRRCSFAGFAVQQSGQRHRRGRQAAFGGRHGPQRNPLNAQGARMSGEVIGRCSGSGQDEPARLGASVAGAPHGPPHGRNALPFIDEPWCRSFEHSGGVGLGQ